MEPEYIVFVMPPKGVDAESFDISEWEFACALDIARRYRERGWSACIIDYGMPFVPWLAKRLGGPDMRVFARTCDEACIKARAISEDYCCFQRML